MRPSTYNSAAPAPTQARPQPSDKGDVLVSAERSKQRALESLDKLPPFSPVLNKLLATLARDDVSFAKVAELIEKDTVVAGNVLGLVNSALYGRSGRVNSVRHAVSLLGTNKIRNAALSMSITRMWSRVRMPKDWSMTRFNQHSIAVAMLADLFSLHAPVHYPEGAFVVGLLHDLGELLIAFALPDEYTAIDQLAQTGRSRLDCEVEVLGFHHATLSGEALKRWNLPLPIQRAAEHHHDPASDPTPLSGGEIALSRLVQAADQYSHQLGITVNPGPETDAAEALAALGIADGLPKLLEEFETEFENIKTFF